MRLEQILQYIQAEYAILAVVLYCLGRALKSINRFPNEYIPLALTGCGVLLGCLSAVSRSGEYANPAAAVFDGLVQGVLCTGLAVYLKEILSHRRTDESSHHENTDKKE